jgi:transposase
VWPESDPLVGGGDRGEVPGKRPRPLAAMAGDRRGQWLQDEDFAAAFDIRGRPGWPPSRLALVTVLQRAENLTDRQAAEAVRIRVDWQYLLGLALDDPGFDHSVLAEFRARVSEGGLEQVTLDALLKRLAEDGLVKAGQAYRLHPRGRGAEPAGTRGGERAGRA